MKTEEQLLEQQEVPACRRSSCVRAQSQAAQTDHPPAGDPPQVQHTVLLGKRAKIIKKL